MQVSFLWDVGDHVQHRSHRIVAGIVTCLYVTRDGNNWATVEYCDDNAVLQCQSFPEADLKRSPAAG